MMIPKIRIWQANGAMSPIAQEITQAVWLSGCSCSHSQVPQPTSIGVRPSVPRAAFIGAVIVPPELDACVALNGTLLWSGIHGLRHADRLEINGHSIWIAAIRSVEPCAYDPAVHGADVFCILTKARLSPGESIVLCPGSGGEVCNVIYKKEAWEMAMQASSNLRCPNCKFRPDDADWQPPNRGPKKRIHELLGYTTDGRN
jgi:hypothetical protein